MAVVKLARYISQFSDERRDELTYKFWKDYRFNMTSDKRLQLLLQSDITSSVEAGDRKRRFDVAFAEGRAVADRVGTVISAGVPEFQSGGIYNLAKPMFTLIHLLGMDVKAGEMTTTSRKIKAESVAVAAALRDARALIKEWSGGELSSSPSYKQLAGYTVRMLDKMVGGKLEKIGVNQVATIEQITVKDARRPGGKTTRRRLEKVTQYEMNFPASGEAKLTALDRVKMLKKLDL